MSCTSARLKLELIGNYKYHPREAVLVMERDRPSFSIRENDIENFPVCENGKYFASIEFNTSDGVRCADKFRHATVFLNDEEIGVVDKNGQINFKINDRFTNYPFSCQYDLLLISVHVEYDDNQPAVELYSKYIPCSSANPKDSENAQKMFIELYEFNDVEVCKQMFPAKPSPQSLTSGGWKERSFKTLLSHVQLLEKITRFYKDNYTLFHSKAKHSVQKTKSLHSYEKVRSVTSSDFSWLTQNMEQLVSVAYPTSIAYRDKHYLPSRIQTEKSVSNRDVYENQVILGFLATICKEAKQMRDELYQLVNEGTKAIQKIRSVSDNIPIVSVLQVPLNRDNGLLHQLEKLCEQLESLYCFYQSTLKCREFSFKSLPRKTKTFQNVLPYRQAFEIILEWYNYGEFDLSKHEALFRTTNLDKILEYYCLHLILREFLNKGFTFSKDSILFQYKLPENSKHNHETDVNNTFYMVGHKCSITIYYQPVLRNDIPPQNDLTLFRTTHYPKGERYYTPDFLLKIQQDGQEPTYIVLDAKYSSEGNITKRYSSDTDSDVSNMSTLENAIQKYFCQLATTEGNSVKAVWLLRGRMEGKNWYNYHNSSLAKKYPPQTEWGIFAVNTDVKLQYLWEELAKYLPR